MRVLLAVMMVVCAAPPAAAQTATSVRGSVVDSSGGAVEGAVVELSGPAGSHRATTNLAGQFAIDGIAPGAYRLTAKRERFRETGLAIVVPRTTPVDVRIEPVFVETVVVTASRGPQTLLTAPAAVTIVEGDAAVASGADSFADILRGVPGLNITQFGARDVEVNSRSATGILSNAMLVMVDGRAFFQPFYGAVYWDLLTITPREVDQIEVLRSPASAMWGANALSGVINVRTKSPRQMTGFRGEVSAGGRGTRSASATWAAASSHLSYKLSASYFEQDAWDRDDRLPGGSPMPVTARFTNRGTQQPKADLRVDFDGDRERVWSLRAGMAGANGLIHSALGPVEFGSGSYYSYLEVDHRRPDLEFKAYWNRLEAPFRIVLFGLDEASINDTFVAELTRRVRLGSRHQMAIGGMARNDRFNTTIAPGDRGRFDAAVFGEDRIALGSRLSVVAGARLDRFDTTGAVFAPRLGAVFTSAPGHSWRVTYNRAYRAPSLLENFVDIALPAALPIDPPFFFTQFSRGSTGLDMEKQDAIEAGFTGAVGTRTTVFVTAYHQVIRNNIWFLPVSFYGPEDPPAGWPYAPDAVPTLARTFSFVNLGRVRDRGVELATRIDWPGVVFQASYTWRDAPLLESGAPFPLEINRPARHQANAALTFRTNVWTVGGDVHYTGRAFWSDVFTQEFWGHTDPYAGVNARAEYRLPGRLWAFHVSGTNVFDERIQSHVFGDIIRRKVVAGVSWRSH